jgi:hypothetical protein
METGSRSKAAVLRKPEVTQQMDPRVAKTKGEQILKRHTAFSSFGEEASICLCQESSLG